MANCTGDYRGFTLIEVLLVLVIIGVLAGVLVMTVGDKPDQAKIEATRIIISKVVNELEGFKGLFNQYPDENMGGIKALVEKPDFGDNETLASKWRAPFMTRKQLKDAWDRDLMYEVVDEQSGDVTRKVVHVWSLGPNGQDENGTGDDIKSWEDKEGA